VNCLENGCQADTQENRIGKKILIISLDALGNVLDNTPVLSAVKREYPESTIHWITQPAAVNILKGNPLIDRLYAWNDENRMILRQIAFDIVYNADKSDYACAFANEVSAGLKKGFLLNDDGIIIPADADAYYSYQLGNDDQLKFRENNRSGINILHEAFGLKYQRDECIYTFTDEERAFIAAYKEEIGYSSDAVYVGFNTGCSELFPNKKMTVEQHIALISDLINHPARMIVLLGGREDTERNTRIYDTIPVELRHKVINTPTTQGIRRGACYMEIPDIVITGDSFGMHLAIALKKHIVAWFGMSCAAEIELYDRGIKLVPEGLACSPCWKKQCPYNLECIEMIDLKKIVHYVDAFKK
jgi:heptosyltransferase-2